MTRFPTLSVRILVKTQTAPLPAASRKEDSNKGGTSYRVNVTELYRGVTFQVRLSAAFPGGDMREVQVAAGCLCSSTRAEFFALRPALKELSSGEDRAAFQSIVVGTESLAVMALLQSDPCARRTSVIADIWSLLRPRAR